MAPVMSAEHPDHLLKWLEAVQTEVVRAVEPLLDERALGVGMRRLRILQLIPDAGIRQTELATRAMVTKQALGPVVEGLELDGLVSRTPDPTDARAWLVRLTPEGQQVTTSLDDAVSVVEGRLAGTVGAVDAETFWRVLRHVGGEGLVMPASEDGQGS
jgi:DNA-binding MarR family transcriptional regulator